MPKINLRGGFSDRNGIKPITTEMQYKELNERTRIALTNTLNSLYHFIFGKLVDYKIETKFWNAILTKAYLQQVDHNSRHSYSTNNMFEIVNDTIINGDYDDVLTIVEFFIRCLNDITPGNMKFEGYDVVNRVFKTEYVGYRFVAKKIVKITDEQEIESINDAISTEYHEVNNHFLKSIKLLSDRNNPDYGNSIKESITAVETMCSLITGSHDSLGKTIKKLEENGVVIHEALKQAFDKLYGYTSDAKGVRHSGQLGGNDATFAEAKFMLVACSGFVNYLKENWQAVK